jgi:heat-inducible transcriptional repressor
VSSELSERQIAILRRVVDEYVASGQPVGSKTLVARGGLGVSPSTVRSELAELELRGLLTHPHTSAGRVPTAWGYRLYVDGLLERLEPRPPDFPLELGAGRGEVEAALQATTEMLSQLTSLLALVSAPPLASATVRHVEVLLLQPQVVMALVITSTGGVTKRVVVFDEAVDAGLANWAAQYLNEQAAGLELGDCTSAALPRCSSTHPGVSSPPIAICSRCSSNERRSSRCCARRSTRAGSSSASVRSSTTPR